MFVTIMRTARISDLRKGHLTAGFVPQLRVGSFHRNDSAGCTIVTIERPSPHRLSAGPLYMCICALHVHSGSGPPESSCCIETIIVFRPALPRTAATWVSAEVLANHRPRTQLYNAPCGTPAPKPSAATNSV